MNNGQAWLDDDFEALVFHGDCLRVMRDTLLGRERASAVITDPPYASGATKEAGKVRASCQGVRTDEWFDGDNMSTTGLVWLIREVCLEARRLLVTGGSLLLFCDWRMLSQLQGAVESTGLRVVNLIVWDKGHYGMGQGFRTQHELIIHATKGVGSYHDASIGNVITAQRVAHMRREHPTQKPIALLRQLLRVVSPEGGVIVDPFCGSGSLGVAAMMEGRRFVGIEADERFADVARGRIGASRSDKRVQACLFG